MGVDWLALSFVQRAADVVEAKALVKDRALVLSKIEKPAAVENIDEIVTASDGIMVARGDLGVELPVQEVPRVQKSLVTQARLAGKPVIVATQMLESMIEAPVPTRAEVSDVATATKSALAIETSYGFGKSGLVWSNAELGPSIDDPVLRAREAETLIKAEANARRILQDHRVLLLEMAKDLLRRRILEGVDLHLWIDRIRGDAPWDPDDPSGRQQAMEQAAVTGKGEVIVFAAHRPDAP